MHSALKSLVYVALGAGLLSTTVGCEQCEVDVKDGDSTETRTGFCSVEKFIEDKARSGSAAYTPGDDVHIVSANGQVKVVRGNSDDVSATFKAFVFRSFKTEDSEIEDNFTHLDTTVTQEGGVVVVEVDRVGTFPSSLGADVTVNLPEAFDGNLIVDQRNGSIDLDYTASASGLDVHSHNGSIEGEATGPASAKIITDNGKLTFALGAASSVQIESGNGDVAFSIGTLLPDAAGGTIKTTGLGDITLGMPSSGDYAVVADGADAVTFATPPENCEVAEGDATAKTLSCGEATPVFTATSDSGAVSVSF